MVANLHKMLCFQQSQEWYATLNPCHMQSDRWNPLTLILSPGARIWIVCVSIFQGALQALSHICMDFVHTCEAPMVSDRKANAFRRKLPFSPILIFFSIIACKANPTPHDDLLFWSISLSGVSSYVVSVGWWCWWWGSQAQWGRKQRPRLLPISGAFGWPWLLGSLGVAVDSWGMNLPGLPLLPGWASGNIWLRLPPSVGWEVIWSPAAVLLLQFWGLKPDPLLLLPFRVPLWLSLELFAMFIMVLGGGGVGRARGRHLVEDRSCQVLLLKISFSWILLSSGGEGKNCCILKFFIYLKIFFIYLTALGLSWGVQNL